MVPGNYRVSRCETGRLTRVMIRNTMTGPSLHFDFNYNDCFFFLNQPSHDRDMVTLGWNCCWMFCTEAVASKVTSGPSFPNNLQRFPPPTGALAFPNIHTKPLTNPSSLGHCGGGGPGSKANKAKQSGDIANSCALTRPFENTEKEWTTAQLEHTHSQLMLANTRWTPTPSSTLSAASKRHPPPAAKCA